MISAIIPTYKNRNELLKNLSHNLPFLKGCETIVVNDDPEESLRREIASFKGVRLIENDVNLGFGPSVNKGVKTAKGRYLVLLNSDVSLKENDFGRLVHYFEKDPGLFGVGFAQREKDRRIVGRNKFFWKGGLFMHEASRSTERGATGWVEGGACMLDKDKYEELGGFDSIYVPFYWEDIDLSYRAWKRGYHVLFDPAIAVDHHHESTIGTYFAKSFVKEIAYRNQYIFIWKNITDGKLMRDHITSLPFLLFSFLVKRELAGIKGFTRAFFKLNAILGRRGRQRKTYRKSDAEIL